jgi:hypothetical protein
MTQLKIISTLVFYNLFVISCSTSQSQLNNYAEQIDIVDVETWINLMPGGPGSFHISGKYELPEELNEKEIFLDKIVVRDSDKEIYNLIAELQFVKNSEKETKEFVFTNSYQTKINPILMQRDSIDVQLVFSINGGTIKRDFIKIPLTRAY